MTVLYEDAHLAVCVKPAGVLSEDAPGGMPELLRERWGEGAYVGVIHRLDRPVGGVMVYARTPAAAAALSRAVTARRVEKRYLAAVCGAPAPAAGEMTDLLFKDSRVGKTFVVDRPRKGVREAKLLYRTVAAGEGLSLVEVTLVTGRSHQIRAQFSSRGWPLWGDRRYGAHTGDALALWSCALAFPHPATGEEMRFFQLPGASDWDAPAYTLIKKGWSPYGNS